jgi:hypothetical protein
MVMGTLTMSCCDYNFQANLPISFLIIDETTIVLLDSLADPHSNGIEINFLSEQSDSQKVFQLD